MEAMRKLDGGIGQIRKVNFMCGMRDLEEVRPTSKES